MVRHTSGKHLLMNAFLNDIPVKVVADTAAMITLVNEKLICGEEHGDEGLVKLRGLGEHLVYELSLLLSCFVGIKKIKSQYHVIS
jgi:hypothetical protein